MYSSIKHLVYEQSRLVSSVGTIYSEVWFPFAFGFLFFAFLFPAIRAVLLVVVLASVRSGFHVPHRGRLFRYAEELRVWSMPEVVTIAGAIAYYRASIPADVEVRAGAWCYVSVAILSFIVDRSLDWRGVWNAILPDSSVSPSETSVSCSICEMVVTSRGTGDACPRCGARLDRNVVNRFAPALAALAAAIPLAFPAYSFAIIVNDQLTAVLEHTVLGTVQLLADYGYWQIGVVVLIAGVVVPLVEMLGMAWLLMRVRFPNTRGLVIRTRVYRILQRLMRWPMVLPFIAAIAAPIVNYRGIDDIVAGPGATPMFAVIALLMLSLRLFEPKMMWKTAGLAS